MSTKNQTKIVFQVSSYTSLAKDNKLTPKILHLVECIQ